MKKITDRKIRKKLCELLTIAVCTDVAFRLKCFTVQSLLNKPLLESCEVSARIQSVSEVYDGIKVRDPHLQEIFPETETKQMVWLQENAHVISPCDEVRRGQLLRAIQTAICLHNTFTFEAKEIANIVECDLNTVLIFLIPLTEDAEVALHVTELSLKRFLGEPVLEN